MCIAHSEVVTAHRFVADKLLYCVKCAVHTKGGGRCTLRVAVAHCGGKRTLKITHDVKVRICGKFLFVKLESNFRKCGPAEHAAAQRLGAVDFLGFKQREGTDTHSRMSCMF